MFRKSGNRFSEWKTFAKQIIGEQPRDKAFPADAGPAEGQLNRDVMSDTSIAASLAQALATATAPGGILARKSRFVTSAGVLLGLAVVGFVIFGVLRREPDPAAIRLNDPDLARLPTQSTVALDEQT